MAAGVSAVGNGGSDQTDGESLTRSSSMRLAAAYSPGVRNHLGSSLVSPSMKIKMTKNISAQESDVARAITPSEAMEDDIIRPKPRIHVVSEDENRYDPSLSTPRRAWGAPTVNASQM